jgi:hypothetical protein
MATGRAIRSSSVPIAAGAAGAAGAACLPSNPSCKGPKGDTGAQGPGAISFGFNFPEDTGGFYVFKSFNGFDLDYICHSDGAYYFFMDSGGLGVVGTQQINAGAPIAVHTGGTSITFTGSTIVDLNVIVSDNAVGKWVNFNLTSLHRAGSHNCFFGGLITPPAGA